MKYTIIAASVIWLYFLGKFVEAVMQRGLPTHPVYYVSAIIGVIIGFLFHQIPGENNPRRRSVLILISGVVLFGLSAAFAYSRIEILRQIGSGLFFWYLFSLVTFGGFSTLMKWRHSKKLTEAEARGEYMMKGQVLAVFFLVLVLLPVIILGIVAHALHW